MKKNSQPWPKGKLRKKLRRREQKKYVTKVLKIFRSNKLRIRRKILTLKLKTLALPTRSPRKGLLLYRLMKITKRWHRSLRVIEKIQNTHSVKVASKSILRVLRSSRTPWGSSCFMIASQTWPTSRWKSLRPKIIPRRKLLPWPCRWRLRQFWERQSLMMAKKVVSHWSKTWRAMKARPLLRWSAVTLLGRDTFKRWRQETRNSTS